jgi:hypothetical protein
VAMAIPAPEASWGLLAVDPDVSESLAVVALCEAGRSSLCFNLYYDVTEVGKRNDSL